MVEIEWRQGYKMRTNLYKLSFYNTIISILIFAILLGYSIYKFSDNLYLQKVEKLEKSFYEKNKILVHKEVDRAISSILTLKNNIYKESKVMLVEKIKVVKNLLDNNKGENNVTNLLLKYKEILDTMKWDQETGYFYIFDQKGNILYHGADKEVETKNIFTLAKGNEKLLEFLNTSLENEENYGSYDWKKPNTDENTLFEKLVYIEKDKKYNIYIAAGIYKDELDKKILGIVKQEIYVNKFGENDYGYLWINDLDEVMRIHPINPELEGSTLDYMKTTDGKYILKEINKKAISGGGYVEYEWYRPDNLQKDKKISYVKLIGDWPLVIGSGFYLTELQDILKSEKDDLKKSTDKYIVDLLIVMSVMVGIVIIVTRLVSIKIKKIEDERVEQMNMLQQYKLVLDKSSVVSKANTKGVITYVNDQFEKVSEYKKDEAIGRAHNIVRHPDTPKIQFEKLWKTISKGEIWVGIIKNKKKSGESYFNNTTIVPIKDSNGKILEYISSGMDVTELLENRIKLQSLFKTDVLTGLGNRVSLLDMLSQNDRGILGLINIDRFKEVNDSYSNDVGDEVIKIFANRLFKFFNEKNYNIFRVQADIFAFFSIDVIKENVLNDVKEFMETFGKKPFQINETKFILTYTCGIASNSENLFTYADIALSEAKNKKIKIKEYDESMKHIDEYKNNIQWVERLHLAIKENRIIPHFQPIYNYKTNKIEKYEALMRLVEDDKIIYPNEYLDIAKNTKLYPELTYKMVEKVISKFSQNDLEFSINLSIEDLMNEELMIFLFDYAEQKDIFKRMVLEIVESEEMEDSDHIEKVIKKFKNKGAKIAIDDFGSGYSNYEYLITLQADYLKIDGSIIKLILTDTRTLDVVKSITEFAKKSNIKVIAEFVSDEKIDKVLKDIGIDYAQGFYYGKPQEKLVEEIS
jgi:diguanylate cyclase (GGDEF)-like protein/PAS domain S-box-containing protein